MFGENWVKRGLRRSRSGSQVSPCLFGITRYVEGRLYYYSTRSSTGNTATGGNAIELSRHFRTVNVLPGLNKVARALAGIINSCKVTLLLRV